MHITTKYKWVSRKLSRKVHIIDEFGLTYCKIENGMNRDRLDGVSNTVPDGRSVCRMCTQLIKKAVKKKSRPKSRPQKKRRDNFLQSQEWARIRYEALKRSRGKCECCGRSSQDGAVMNVDHIEPRHKRPDLALTLSNLQILCSWCNQGKGGWDDTDWREPRLATLMGERMD